MILINMNPALIAAEVQHLQKAAKNPSSAKAKRLSRLLQSLQIRLRLITFSSKTMLSPVHSPRSIPALLSHALFDLPDSVFFQP